MIIPRGLLRFFLAAAVCMVIGCGPKPMPAVVADGPRLVSMAPSITELLFELGCGDQVVGLTAFCAYPPQTAGRPVIGGYYDTNYELIFSLQPDLVLLPVEHVEAAERLRALGLECRMLDTATLPAIFSAIRTLGELCGVPEAARALSARMRDDLERVRAHTAAAPPRKVMISIGRNMGAGDLDGVYLAGSGTLYDEMLSMLGAANVFHGRLPYAQVGREGILRMNPDVIIDLAPDLEKNTGLTRAQAQNDWNSLTSVNAVRNGRVHVLDGSYVCIPGPRITMLFEDIARAVYPDHFKAGPPVNRNKVDESG